MCKSVYLKGTKRRKPRRRFSDRIYVPMPRLRSTVSIFCDSCRLYLTDFERADPRGIDTTVKVPPTFCLCSFTQEELSALAQYGKPAAQETMYRRLFARIGAAAQLANGDEWDVKQAIERAEDDRLLFKIQAMMILRERGQEPPRKRKVATLKAKIDAGVYHVPGEAIADCMLQKMARAAA